MDVMVDCCKGGLGVSAACVMCIQLIVGDAESVAENERRLEYAWQS